MMTHVVNCLKDRVSKQRPDIILKRVESVSGTAPQVPKNQNKKTNTDHKRKEADMRRNTKRTCH